MEEKNKTGKRISNVLRYICGVFFILTGFSGMLINNILAGFFMMLFGISLLPVLYKKTKLNQIKHIQIILPIILIIIYGMSMPDVLNVTYTNIIADVDTNTSISTNIVQETKNIDITNLKFNEAEIELDINESKNITLEIEPENANIDSLEYCSSNDKVATIERTDTDIIKNKITLKINPIAEGNCEIFVKTNNGIESNRVTVKIIDNNRIEQERIKAEEQAKKEAEEQKQKQVAAESASTKKEDTSTSKTTTTTKKKNSKSTSNNSNGKTVYRTPTGKRYHYDPDCGGKNSYSTTLDAALSAGLTPCKKCAQ